MTPSLVNADARRLFLHRHGLDRVPNGPAIGRGLADLIHKIGFVQVDSINTVERAHHMILWARRQSYRPPMLKRLLEQDRTLFEHWTHDASIMPMALFPYWKHRFTRDAERLHNNWQRWFRDGYETQFDTILKRIARDGPVSSSDVGEGEARGKGGWWDWHPSKTALEWLWRTGQIAVTRRDGFRKVYDLTENVVPAHLYRTDITPEAHIDWACSSALDRLGFATVAEIARYWNAIDTATVKGWLRSQLDQQLVVPVIIQEANGGMHNAFIRPDALADLPEPVTRLRILSPFDPALRDRSRIERLFGFHYRIEVFVPEAKRQYGYYVFPVLEGTQLIARLDCKAWRAEGCLRVRGFWPERGIRMGKARLAALDAELARLAAFSGCARVEFGPDWLHDAPA